MACAEHLKACRFFPTVAHILEIVEEQREQRQLMTPQRLIEKYKKENAEEEKRRLAGMDGPALDGKPKLQ